MKLLNILSTFLFLFSTQATAAATPLQAKTAPTAHCSTNYALYGRVIDNIACTLAMVDMEKNDRLLEIAYEDRLPIVFYGAGVPHEGVSFSELDTPRRYTYRTFLSQSPILCYW